MKITLPSAEGRASTEISRRVDIVLIGTQMIEKVLRIFEDECLLSVLDCLQEVSKSSHLVDSVLIAGK